MATMADVARSAGVSVATVSHVLNGTRFVREETRQRVLQAIEQAGYIHNTLARSLATAKTRTVALALSAISNPYFMDLVHAAEVHVRQAGFMMFLADTHDRPDEELRVVQAMHQRRVDGFLLAPSPDPERQALQYLERHRVPTVLVDRMPSNRFDQVGTENVEATSQLVEHLAALGHRRIAFVSGLEGLATTTERVQGYRLGLDRSGLPYEARLVRTGASDVEPARDAVHRMLAATDPPSALVVANNRMTIGAMRAVRELGLRVPDDLALVAFDDFEWADLFQPRLTTIAQPTYALGAQAVRMLLERIAEPDRAPRSVRLTPQFVHRESCGCREKER